MEALITLIRQRLLCASCGLFLLVLFLDSFLSPSAQLPMLVIGAAAVGLSFFVYARVREASPFKLLPYFALAALAAFLVGWLYFGLRVGGVSPYLGRTAAVEGVVLEEESRNSYSTQYVVKVKKIDGRKVSCRALLRLEEDSALRELDEFTVTAELSAFSEKTAGFYERSYYQAKGILFRAESEGDYTVTGRAKGDLFSIMASLNASLREILYYAFPDRETAGFFSALLLGQRGDLSGRLARDMRAVGISHLTALSGLHLSILCMLLGRLFRLLRIGKNPSDVLQMVFAVLYMLLTGMPLTVVRAGMMLILVRLTRLLGYESDGPTVLLATASAICLVSPNSVGDVGFQMSCLATFGILTLGRRMCRTADAAFGRIGRSGRIVGFLRRLTKAVCVSAAAILFSLPVSWSAFGEISLLGIPATLLFTPFIVCFLTAAPLLFPVYLLSPVLSLYPARLLEGLFSLMRAMLGQIASPDCLISLRYGFVPYVLLLAVLTFFLLLHLKKRPFPSFFVSCAVSAAAFALCLCVTQAAARDEIELTYLASNRNEAFVLFSGGHGFVCDLSDGSAAISREAVGVLSEKYCATGVEVYLLTHYHKRHISTVHSLCDRYYLGSILLPVPADADECSIAETIARRAEEDGIGVIYYEYGDLLGYHGAELCIRSADVGYSTHPVLALACRAGERSLVYAGSSAYNSPLYPFLEEEEKTARDVILGVHGPKQKNGVVAACIPSPAASVWYPADGIRPSGFDSAVLHPIENDGQTVCAAFSIGK